MIAAIQLPPFPPTHDLVKLLPELILSGAFVLLLLLDLVVPAVRRALLAVFSAASLVGTMVSIVFAWFDAGERGSLAYYGTFAYDRFSLFIDGIVVLSALLVVLISPAYLNRRGLHYGEYYSLILAATVGMMLLSGAMNLMVIFLGIELLSISLYVLSGFALTQPRSQEAGLKYLLLGGFASGFLLYGMALVYGETGHTQLTQIAQSLTAEGSTTDSLFLVGVGLIFVGFAFKISAAPFHFWTPDVYQGAPTSVTAFMSVATKVAAFAALIRVFNATFQGSFNKWGALVVFVSIISMAVGNLFALAQTSVKRMLAYSGIAQAGYILIGVAVESRDATIGSLYYLAVYAAMNLGAFAVITIMAGRGEDIDAYDSLRGLFYRRPYIAGAMALFLLSLGGFPPTAGFIAKFLVFRAAIDAGQVPLALWGIATSVISVFYYLRVGLIMFTRPRDGEVAYPWARTTVAGGTVMLVTSAATLAFGAVSVGFLYDVASMAQGGALPGLPHA